MKKIAIILAFVLLATAVFTTGIYWLIKKDPFGFFTPLPLSQETVNNKNDFIETIKKMYNFPKGTEYTQAYSDKVFVTNFNKIAMNNNGWTSSAEKTLCDPPRKENHGMMLRRDGSIASGTVIAGALASKYNKMSYLTFYPDGAVESIAPIEPIMINGTLWTCDQIHSEYSGQSLGRPIELHPNGNVKQGILAKDQDFDGKKYQKGQFLQFKIDGKIIETK